MESLWPIRGCMEERSLAFIKTQCKVDQRHVHIFQLPLKVGTKTITNL